MGVADMWMFRWMCGKTRINKIKSEYILEMAGVTSIKYKLRENKLRWFCHVRRRLIDTTVRNSDMITLNGNVLGDEGKTKLTWGLVVKNDMNLFNLTKLIALDRE